MAHESDPDPGPFHRAAQAAARRGLTPASAAQLLERADQAFQ
ncbi:hypothetical protein ACFVT9_28605 [Kitasatospora cineracea]